jgi:dihydroorotate dehydrogenase
MSEPAGAYERIVRPLLFSLDPETAHHLAIGCLRFASRSRMLLSALRTFEPGQAKPVEVFGLRFRNRVGLAAGFDKNAVALPAWEALGFGFLEVGTITAKAQPGNPRPRIFRYPAHQAVINRLGFNNDGADAIADRLRRLRDAGRWPGIPVGINIGKSKVTPLEAAAEDYLYSFRRLFEFADYLALNVSSPNTPGLRSLQAHDSLGVLLSAIQAENRGRRPVLLKIAPDLDAAELTTIIQLCESHGIAGIIATNTTLDHSCVPAAEDQSGGLSGAPLGGRATAILRSITSQTTLPVIGVGGVFDAASAREKLSAGAALLQVYTGYIYRGPGMLREVASAF